MTLVYTHAKCVNEPWNLQNLLVAKLGVQVGLQPPLCDLILAANMGTLNVASIGISATKPGDWTGHGISVGNMDIFTATCAFCQDNHIWTVGCYICQLLTTPLDWLQPKFEGKDFKVCCNCWVACFPMHSCAMVQS